MLDLVLLWLAWFLALGLAALPATAALLAPLDGRGAGFAVTVGATVVSLVAFWVGHVAFGRGAVLLGVVVLLVCSGVALRAGVTVPWRRYVDVSGVFALVFGFAVGLRSLTPALQIWAELYLDLGLVQSVLRSPALPLEDMWFAGHTVQYYYGGHFTAATWAIATGTPGRFVPNVGLAGFFTMLVVGGYDLAGSLGRAAGAPRRLAGVTGAFLLGFAGNLFPTIRLLVVALPDGVGTLIRRGLALSPELVTGSFMVFDATHLGATNTDFPIYSLFIQSLHPHVMSQPFTLLVAAICSAFFLTDAGRRRAGRLIAASPVVGLVAFTNTWSFPAAAGLVALTVAFSTPHPVELLPDWERLEPLRARPLFREVTRYAGGVFAGLLVATLAVGWVAPFFATTNTNRPLVFLPERSGLRLFVVGYGVFLALFVLYLEPRLRASVQGERTRATAAGIFLSLTVAAWWFDFAALAFVAPLLLAGWWWLRRGDGGFLAVLVVAGAGLALLVEVVYVQDGAAAGRYNTLYKVHSQVWLLWSVAAGVAAAATLGEAGRFGWRTVRGVSVPVVDHGIHLGSQLRVAAVVCLLIAASLYGVFTVGSGVINGPPPGGPTLDSTRFIETDHPDHAAAIEWLSDRHGRPVIVSGAVGEYETYRISSAPAASLTGLPTVVGWAHAADYHSRAAFETRVGDVATIYTGSVANRSRLLRKYDVRYIYVSPFERSKYDVVALDAQRGIRLAFRRGNVSVYAVDQSTLPMAEERSDSLDSARTVSSGAFT